MPNWIKLLVAAGVVTLSVCATSSTEPEAPAEVTRSSRPSSALQGETHRQAITLPTGQQLLLRIPLDGEPSLGDRNATLGIVEFTDLQCSYCARFHRQVFPKLKEQYIDRQVIRYVVKDFPLKIHKDAMSAAIAANCAMPQNQYWAFQDGLFANQNQLNTTTFNQLATELNLDRDTYTSCLNDPNQKWEVYHDITAGIQLNVRGTPTFFIGKIENNVLIVKHMAKGVPSFEAIAKEIKSLQSDEN